MITLEAQVLLTFHFFDFSNYDCRRKKEHENIDQGILSPSSLCKLIVQRALDSKRLTQDTLCKFSRQALRKFSGSSDSSSTKEVKILLRFELVWKPLLNLTDEHYARLYIK